MVARLEIVLFLEDAAHEVFLCTLVHRVALDAGIDSSLLDLNVRNATGGIGQMQSSYVKFLRDVAKGYVTAPLIVVGQDSDCAPRQRVLTTIRALAERTGFQGDVVGAIPIPHIERWYMLDPHAFLGATGGAAPPQLVFRCEKDYYKSALIHALEDFGIPGILGAAPYGEDIARGMDIPHCRQADNSFDAFFVDLRQSLVQLAAA